MKKCSTVADTVSPAAPVCTYFLFYCIHFSYCVWWPCRKKKGKDVDVVFVHDFRAPGDTLGMLQTDGIDVRSLPWPKELPPVGWFRSIAVVSMNIFYRVAVFACVLTYLSSLPAYVTPPASDPSVPLSFLCCRMWLTEPFYIWVMKRNWHC